MGITLLIIGLVAALVASAYVKKVQTSVKVLTALAILSIPAALALGLGIIVGVIVLALFLLVLAFRAFAWVVNKISDGGNWVANTVDEEMTKSGNDFITWVTNAFKKISQTS